MHSSILAAIIVLAYFPGNTMRKNPATAHRTFNQPAEMTIALACERQLNSIEQAIIDAADAMPVELFDFTPDSLHVKGAEFTGVRSFAGQVKHLATDNFAIWNPLTGSPMPAGVKNVNGPDDIRTKADIMKYLRGSFAEGRKAIASLTRDNATELLVFRGNKLPRLDLAFYALSHANEHYGQMVVYLRLVGIIPPASRPR